MSSYDRGYFRGIERVLLIQEARKLIQVREGGQKVLLGGLILSSVKCWKERNQEVCVFKADSTACLVLWVFKK